MSSRGVLQRPATTGSTATVNGMDVVGGDNTDLIYNHGLIQQRVFERLRLSGLQAEAAYGHTTCTSREFEPRLGGQSLGWLTGHVAVSQGYDPRNRRIRRNGPAKGGMKFKKRVTGQLIKGHSVLMLEKVDFHKPAAEFGQSELDLNHTLWDLEAGKCGLDPGPRRYSRAEVEAVVAGFVREFRDFFNPDVYVSATDEGTDAGLMAIIAQIAGPQSITGKPYRRGAPAEQNGLEEQVTFTGYGLAQAAALFAQHTGDPLGPWTRIGVHGMGKVGLSFAHFVSALWGCKITHASDMNAGICREDGLPIADLGQYMKPEGKGRGSLAGFEHCDEQGSPEQTLFAPVDLLVTASTSGVVTTKEVGGIQAKRSISGGNGCFTVAALDELEAGNHLYGGELFPNSGGICSSNLERHINLGTFSGGADDGRACIRRIFAAGFDRITWVMREYGFTSMAEAEVAVATINRLDSVGLWADN